MNLAFLLKCLLIWFYHFQYVVVEIDASHAMSHAEHEKMLEKSNVQDFPQHSASEFSEDITEKSKPKKKKSRKKKHKKKKLQSEEVTRRKNGKKKMKKKPKKVKKINKNVNIDNVYKKGPVDIIVHIKMGE